MKPEKYDEETVELKGRLLTPRQVEGSYSVISMAKEPRN
jgi:hypothetical protein